MRIGVLTGGGDCPGLNAVIRAIVRKGVERTGHEFVGYRDGWRGPLEDDSRAARRARGARHPAARRHDPRLLADQPVRGGRRRRSGIAENLEADGVDGLIAIGGEDTLGAASRLHDEHGLPVVGVPKTIDNDLGATDYTFGFDTAVNIAMEAIDRLHTTAESHHRVLIVEVMGRHAGWIAFHAGLAGGANVILIPERPFDIERVCELVGRRFEAQFAPIVVVAEGAQPKGGMPGRADAGKPTPSATSASAASPTGSRARSSSAPARRRAPRCSATSSAAARRPPSTGCSPPASACTRSTPPTPGDWGTMTALRGTDIELVDAQRGDRGAEDGAGVALRRGRGLLWLGGGGAGAPSQNERPGGGS